MSAELTALQKVRRFFDLEAEVYEDEEEDENGDEEEGQNIDKSCLLEEGTDSCLSDGFIVQDEEQDGLRPVEHDELYSGRTLQTVNEEEARQIAVLYERQQTREVRMDDEMDKVAYWMVPVRVCEVHHALLIG